MTTYDLAIVGGGISGLTAAYEASKTGKKIILLDPEKLGGVIGTQYEHGFQLENSAHILTAKQSLITLCDELELTIEYPLPACKYQAVFIRGKHISFQRKLLSIALSGLWPLHEMLRALKNILLPDRYFLTQDDLSVTKFITHFSGPKMAEQLLNPILRGVYGGQFESQSAAWLLPKLWTKVRREKSVPTGPKGSACRIAGGNQKLVDALVAAIRDKVEIVQERVTGLEKAGDLLCLKTVDNKMSAHSVFWSADLETLGVKDSSYIPITVAHLSCPSLPQKLIKHFGVLFAEGNCEPLLGIMCYSELFPSTAPKDKQLLTLMFGGTAALGWGTEDVERFVRETLLTHYPLSDFNVLNVVPWQRAIPLYDTGYQIKVSKYKQLETIFPGLQIISRQLSKPGISDRIEMGLKACQNIRR